MTMGSSWRLPLRIARRDALRHRGRSALTLLMIMLPVLAVTAADVLAATQSVSSAESLDRRLGHAAARVTVQQGVTRVDQGVDPDAQSGTYGDDDGDTAPPTEHQVDALLDGRPLVALAEGSVQVAVPHGLASVEVTETDLADPLTHGLFDLTAGRWPAATGEVVINPALAAEGYAIGDRLDVADLADPPRIVGIADSAQARNYSIAAGPAGTFGLPGDTGTTTWLVGGRPVSWATVLKLNDIGVSVLSRQAVEHPPPASQIRYHSTADNQQTIEVLALIAVMALIEVVLLAGPAFAVGARRQQRSLALLAATGGTPRQARRVVLASAVVLGGVASVLGLIAGLGVARVMTPVLQAHSDTWFGPFDVRWLHLLGIAGFGLLSVFLAAVVPASIASRQDVVAVLAGRRGDRAPSLRSPLLGLALLAVGVVGSVAGVRGSGEILIAASAIPSVLGMVLLIPLVLAGIGCVAGRLPLVLRYAVRDAARHRTRTVPAVAAVAATVAGVCALSIGLSSDQHEQRETYQPVLPMGLGMVTATTDAPDWDAVRTVLARDLPAARVRPQPGLAEYAAGNAYVDTRIRVPGHGQLAFSSTQALGATVLISEDGGLPAGLRLTAGQRDTVQQALAAGRSVAFINQTEASGRADIKRTTTDPNDGTVLGRQSAEVPMTFLSVPTTWNGPLAILVPAAVHALGATSTTVALAVTGDLSSAQERDVDQGLSAVSQDVSFYVERGFRPDQSALIVQWILIGMGAVLMLGGTLTATFLALSDARPDLATLAAVGASPRARRGVAAAYAVVVGLVGAVLGAVVGFIPGIAVTYPLTSSPGRGPFIDVPWLSLAVLVIALPLLTALIVGLCARSRLPLMARLD